MLRGGLSLRLSRRLGFVHLALTFFLLLLVASRLARELGLFGHWPRDSSLPTGEEVVRLHMASYIWWLGSQSPRCPPPAGYWRDLKS